MSNSISDVDLGDSVPGFEFLDISRTLNPDRAYTYG